MDVLLANEKLNRTETRVLSRPAVAALWVLSAVALFAFLGAAPVQRTQEARVLETAREMLNAPAHNWLLPRLNGEPRLRKPPLAYWLSAAGFEAFDVTSAAGRAPTALAGWLMLGIIYVAGTKFFNQRAGLFAAGALLSSYMFYRYTRLAETDAQAALGVTAAIWAFWRACESSRRSEAFWWYHLSAVGIAWAAMSKGPPAAFVLLFIVVICVITRSVAPAWGFVRSGALITALVLALAWWMYAFFGPGASQIHEEVQALAGGEDHPASFLTYFPILLLACAPWTGYVVFAIAAAIARTRMDRRLQFLLAWTGAVLVPLFFIGNKQAHYLFPVIPPLLLLAGWATDASLSGVLKDQRQTIKIITYATAIALALGGIAIGIAQRLNHRPASLLDLGLACAVVLAAILVIMIARARGTTIGCVTLGAACALLVPIVLGVWSPRHFERDPQTEVSLLRAKFGNGPYYFYGSQVSLPMVFAMRSEIPILTSPQKTLAAAQRDPNAVILVIDKDGKNTNAPPTPFQKMFSTTTDKRTLTAYRLAH